MAGIKCSYEHITLSHPPPEREEEYFAAYLTNEPVAVGWSIPRVIADAATKLGRDRTKFSVERLTAEQYRTLAQYFPLEEVFDLGDGFLPPYRAS